MSKPVKLEVYPKPGAFAPTIRLHGDTARISSGTNGTDGTIILETASGDATILLNASEGSIVLRDRAVKDTITLSGHYGSSQIKDNSGNDIFTYQVHNSIMYVNDPSGRQSIIADGENRTLSISDESGKPIFGVGAGGLGCKGELSLSNNAGVKTIILDGSAGDISLNDADCAEEFDILESDGVEPGDVMIIEEEGKLRQSSKSYDKRVAGVISGAGECKSGIVLDRKYSQTNRKPVALMGKVYCKVDAQSSPVNVGDLLTTSSIPAHAMKADDPLRAFGAVIGKALKPLLEGRKMIPVLVTLQ